jgi:hypothetical protein
MENASGEGEQPSDDADTVWTEIDGHHSPDEVEYATASPLATSGDA